MATERGTTDLRMDPASLYREETFTDRRLGMIRVLTPVTKDGATDSARKVVYLGEAQLLTQVGALPLTFEIDARSMAEATEKFAAAAKVAVELSCAGIITPLWIDRRMELRQGVSLPRSLR